MPLQKAHLMQKVLLQMISPPPSNGG